MARLIYQGWYPHHVYHSRQNHHAHDIKFSSSASFKLLAAGFYIHILNNLLLIMGKVHGSLARAGKVKSQTPKVEKTEKPKTPQGRAHMRLLYTKRFVNVTLVNGKRKANSNAA